MTKIVVATAMALVLACSAPAQDGLKTPDAATLRITQITRIDEPDTGTLKSSWFQPNNQITTRKSGIRLVAESDTVRYTLSCVIHEGQVTSFGTVTQTWDGDPASFQPVCDGQFHVGDRVVFYSLDNLVWLSITNATHTFYHGSGWKPQYNGGRFWTFKIEFPGSPQVMWDKPYSIDSEDEKPKGSGPKVSHPKSSPIGNQRKP